ncbi:sensor histidine kinase [Plantactinospora siamensis]|uniref:Sensor-like histidine kinase SenX3 n=1 Tax=Plantactinospora siamensis TaxID=555372 RepID=A0ABV6P5U4_9ACTN
MARARRSIAAGAGGRGRLDILADGGAAIEEDLPSGLPGLGRRTVDSLRVGVVVLGPDELPVLINPAARAMGLLRTGPEPGTVVPHPIIRTLAGQVRRTGVRREVELDLPRGRADSGSDPLGVHLRAMGIGEGYVAVEAADVTEAHRVARVRRDFVANVSHELKTPIGALQLLAEALLDATDSADHPDAEAAAEDVAAARRFAERISSESARLGRLVNELLELTRLQGAEPLPAPEPVSLDWVLAEVVDRTRTTASARGIEIEVEGLRGQTVYGSDSQLATAVTNLVENAIAYSGEDTRVTIDISADDEQLEIAVTDQGIGIAPDDVNRIFERFYRADQARSRSTGGTGLGLAIVKHIATNHGGRVQVASTLGGGSTFTLRLPARPPDAFLPPPPSADIDSGSAALR